MNLLSYNLHFDGDHVFDANGVTVENWTQLFSEIAELFLDATDCDDDIVQWVDVIPLDSDGGEIRESAETFAVYVGNAARVLSELCTENAFSHTDCEIYRSRNWQINYVDVHGTPFVLVG